MTLLDVKTYLGQITNAIGTRQIDIMTAFRDHFVTNAADSYFTLHDVTNAGGGVSSFKISPKKADEEWYLEFSLASTNLNVKIDPLRYVEGSSLSPNAAPLLTAGNVTNLNLYSEQFYIVELRDAIFFLPLNTNNAGSAQCIHAGRIYLPYFANDVSLGINGLGILSRGPQVYADTNQTSWNSWLNNWNLEARNGSLLHVSNSATQTSRWIRASSKREISDGYATGSNTLSDNPIRPAIINLSASTNTTNIASTTDSTGANIGYLKYVFGWSAAQNPQTRLVSPTVPGPVQTLFFLSPEAGSSHVVIPWETNVNPW
jgi:hypothetical protein